MHLFWIICLLWLIDEPYFLVLQKENSHYSLITSLVYPHTQHTEHIFITFPLTALLKSVKPNLYIH